MNIILKILILLLALATYLWPGERDPYHLVCGGVSLLIVGIAAAVWSSKSESSESRFAAEDPELAALMKQTESESLGGAIAKGFLLGILVFGLASGLAWIGAKTPIYGMFYDQDFDQFVHDLDVLVEEGNLEAASKRIERRLEEPLSEAKQVVLVERNYELLITLGRRTSWDVEQRAFFGLAKAWAEKWGLDSTLADAEERAVRPADTPRPTYTPYPTPTPMPTSTPTRTPTITPTPTPDVEKPPLDFTKCTEKPVDNRLEVDGVFVAWDCQEWGFYGQWQVPGEKNPVGGRLPQLYVSSEVGRFYLCPPTSDGREPYTTKTCEP